MKRTPHTAHRTPHTAHRTPHTAHRVSQQPTARRGLQRVVGALIVNLALTACAEQADTPANIGTVARQHVPANISLPTVVGETGDLQRLSPNGSEMPMFSKRPAAPTTAESGAALTPDSLSSLRTSVRKQIEAISKSKYFKPTVEQRIILVALVAETVEESMAKLKRLPITKSKVLETRGSDKATELVVTYSYKSRPILRSRNKVSAVAASSLADGVSQFSHASNHLGSPASWLALSEDTLTVEEADDAIATILAVEIEMEGLDAANVEDDMMFQDWLDEQEQHLVSAEGGHKLSQYRFQLVAGAEDELDINCAIIRAGAFYTTVQTFAQIHGAKVAVTGARATVAAGTAVATSTVTWPVIGAVAAVGVAATAIYFAFTCRGGKRAGTNNASFANPRYPSPIGNRIAMNSRGGVPCRLV